MCKYNLTYILRERKNEEYIAMNLRDEEYVLSLISLLRVDFLE